MQRPALWFSITGVVLALLALPARILSPGSGLDLGMGSISFVLAPDKVFLVMAAFSGLFAAAYAAFPMNRRAASWHYWVTVGGIVGFWISFVAWGYLFAEQSAGQSAAPQSRLAAMLALNLSFLVMLFSPAIFAVNFTFAMGKMRMARKPQ
jgi:hypothetical protein